MTIITAERSFTNYSNISGLGVETASDYLMFLVGSDKQSGKESNRIEKGFWNKDYSPMLWNDSGRDLSNTKAFLDDFRFLLELHAHTVELVALGGECHGPEELGPYTAQWTLTNKVLAAIEWHEGRINDPNYSPEEVEQFKNTRLNRHVLLDTFTNLLKDIQSDFADGCSCVEQATLTITVKVRSGMLRHPGLDLMQSLAFAPGGSNLRGGPTEAFDTWAGHNGNGYANGTLVSILEDAIREEGVVIERASLDNIRSR